MDFTNIEERMMKTISVFEENLSEIRAGRANPAILNKISIDYYGTPTPINQVAGISVPEARQINIKPFDRSILGAIEKAIFEANLGVTPNNNGEVVFIVIPPLTEDRRKDLVKQVKALAEEAKVAIRYIRRDANLKIEKEDLAEDEEKSLKNDIQDLVNEYNKDIERLLKEKEEELMTI